MNLKCLNFDFFVVLSLDRARPKERAWNREFRILFPDLWFNVFQISLRKVQTLSHYLRHFRFNLLHRLEWWGAFLSINCMLFDTTFNLRPSQRRFILLAQMKLNKIIAQLTFFLLLALCHIAFMSNDGRKFLHHWFLFDFRQFAIFSSQLFCKIWLKHNLIIHALSDCTLLFNR